MENYQHSILEKIFCMKKILSLSICVILTAMVKAQNDPPPPPPPSKPPTGVVIEKFNPPVITVKGHKADEFYKRNPSVEMIFRQENIVTLNMKDKTTEKYDLSKNEQKASFKKKY